MMNEKAQLQNNQCRGLLLKNESLASYTSWHLGGNAKQIYQPADIDDLSFFLKQLSHNEKIFWLGAGTNLLVREKGFDGTVILLKDAINNIKLLSEDEIQKLNFQSVAKNKKIIYAEAGILGAKLAMFAVEHGLSGLEFLAGIPGTVGGALVMNAGAYGNSTWPHVVSVITVNRQGEQKYRSSNEFDFSYRTVIGKENEKFLAAYFVLESGNRTEMLQAVHAMLAQRKASQPLEFPNAGCVFRNPKNDFAARLIETAGLKGFRIGGACVSTKHANFIVNDNHATPTDVMNIIDHVIKTVREKHHVELEREVIIL